MIVSNTKIWPGLDWEAYAKTPGYSFSYLRNPDGVVPTAGMRLGTLVDRYLFTPGRYNGEQRNLVEPMARELVRHFGGALGMGESQISVTADFEIDGLIMPYKGRPDFKITDLIVDLKVSKMDVVKAVQFFRYDWQLSGYALSTGCTRSMILSINPTTLKITPIAIPIVTDWWEYQIKQYGVPSLRVG